MSSSRVTPPVAMRMDELTLPRSEMTMAVPMAAAAVLTRLLPSSTVERKRSGFLPGGYPFGAGTPERTKCISRTR